MSYIEVEVDLSDYEDEVFEYAEDNGYILKSDYDDEHIEKCIIEDLIEELEKELYVYNTKSITTVEQVLEKLKEIV